MNAHEIKKENISYSSYSIESTTIIAKSYMWIHIEKDDEGKRKGKRQEKIM